MGVISPSGHLGQIFYIDYKINKKYNISYNIYIYIYIIGLKSALFTLNAAISPLCWGIEAYNKNALRTETKTASSA